MPTVIATVGASDANSYVTVAEANHFFSEQFGYSQWGVASAADREGCVITASRSLDAYMAWSGRPTYDDQSMGWPRVDARDRYGRVVPDDEIPAIIKQATFETAFLVLTQGGLKFSGSKYDKVKVAVVDVTFSKNQDSQGIPKFLESMLLGLGTPILSRDGEVSQVRLERA